MNSILIYMMFIILSLTSCGPERGLPMSIYVKDTILLDSSKSVVEMYNSIFGEVFIFSTSFDNSNIQMKCDDEGYFDLRNKAGHAWSSGKVLINCKYEKYLDGIIAHELWHMLGFWHHSENNTCIDYHIVRVGNLSEFICPEMIEEFENMYGKSEPLEE